MLKKLHVYILKSYIGPLFVTFFISLFVLLMQFLWRYVEDLVGKGLHWSIIAELLLYASTGLVPMALPLAILLASIMTFGNLGEYYELTALKAAGISLQRIMFPLIVLSFVISIGAFFFSNYVLPYSNLKTGSLLFDVTHQRPEINIKSGAFNNDIEGYSIKVARKSTKTEMMYDFMIYDHTARTGSPIVVLADSGTMQITDNNKHMVITLYDGIRYEEMTEKNKSKRSYPSRSDAFSKQTIVFKLEGFDFNKTDENLFKHNYQMLNLKQLNFAIDSLNFVFRERVKSFEKNLQINNYLKYEIKPVAITDTPLMRKDSIRRNLDYKMLPVVANLDSIFNTLPENDKNRLIETAVDQAQKTQTLLTSTKEEMYDRKKWIAKHYIVWHRKFTLSFACLIFFFIGAPLGAIIRKGGFGLPIVISVVFFIGYYILSLSGEKFVREGVLPAYEGMWLSSAILLPLGIFLTYKATTDSTIFNIDNYKDKFKFILKLFNRKNNLARTKKIENTSDL